eukprot:873395-Pleurochrysis_carterae.AAC.1
MDPYRVAMALRSSLVAICASEPDSSARNASVAHVAPPEPSPLRACVAARGPAASARALLVGRERRNASRHARGTGRKGVTFVVDS